MSTQENLEERIERIRKRNEELQKRHAEAEADKQKAKKENAMVQTKLTNYDDWPKEHKYDHVDFTFDNSVDENNIVNSEVRSDKRAERFKKSQFAEGDGPPPDPSYSFLKDADRDFNRSEQTRNTRTPNEKPQWNQRDSPSQRGRGSNNRGGNFRGSNRGRPNRDFQNNRNEYQPEYDAWRSERNKIDEARINRQRNAEGKWRREWDVEKINNDGPKNEVHHTHKPDRPTMADMMLPGTRKSLESSFDKIKNNRPNITVSLNQTGEVQSVKVTSPPAIGSGRVGPRQIKPRPIFPLEEPMNYKDKKDDLIENHKPRSREHQKQPKKNIDKSRSPKKPEASPQGGVQNRLNKYKQANGFSQLSKELKDVSAEIEGICSSVENLNKKHGENLDKSVVDVSVLIKNNSNLQTDDFSLSTDLVLDKIDDKNLVSDKIDISDTKCNFGDMKTGDIENYIEREVEKNNICLSPEPEQNVNEENFENVDCVQEKISELALEKDQNIVDKEKTVDIIVKNNVEIEKDIVLEDEIRSKIADLKSHEDNKVVFEVDKVFEDKMTVEDKIVDGDQVPVQDDIVVRDKTDVQTKIPIVGEIVIPDKIISEDKIVVQDKIAVEGGTVIANKIVVQDQIVVQDKMVIEDKLDIENKTTVPEKIPVEDKTVIGDKIIVTDTEKTILNEQEVSFKDEESINIEEIKNTKVEAKNLEVCDKSEVEGKIEDGTKSNVEFEKQIVFEPEIKIVGDMKVQVENKTEKVEENVENKNLTIDKIAVEIDTKENQENNEQCQNSTDGKIEIQGQAEVVNVEK